MKRILILLLVLSSCQNRHLNLESNGVSYSFPEDFGIEQAKLISSNIETTLELEEVSKSIHLPKRVMVDPVNGTFNYYLAYKKPLDLTEEQINCYELVAEFASDLAVEGPVDIFITDLDDTIIKHIPFNPGKLGDMVMQFENGGELILKSQISSFKGFKAFNMLKPYLTKLAVADSPSIEIGLYDKQIKVHIDHKDQTISENNTKALIEAAILLRDSVFNIPVTINLVTKADSTIGRFKSN